MTLLWMLLPDSPIVPRFPGRRHPSDNSALSLLQCTHRLKSSGALCPWLPRPPGPRQAWRPSHSQMSGGISAPHAAGAHSSMVKHLLPLQASNLLNTIRGLCWGAGGWPRTQSPAPLGVSSKLWNCKTAPETLQRIEPHTAEAFKAFPQRKES